MSILSKIFGGEATKLVQSVDNMVDNLHTSKEEKLDFMTKFQALFLDYNTKSDQERTFRWKADMASDSWLSKNIRPITLATMLVALILFTFFDATIINLGVKPVWVELWGDLSKITFAAYFGSRGYEKGQEIKGKFLLKKDGKKDSDFNI